MFITMKDDTGPANIVVWPSLFEKRRRILLGSDVVDRDAEFKMSAG